jgi:cyclase
MQLSSHCYALTGFAYIPPWSVNSGIIAGEETALIVDSGPTRQAAETIHGYAKALHPSNRLLVINTEKHLDHINGNAYFTDQGVDIYGHGDFLRNDAELQNDIADYEACVPDRIRRERREGRIPFTDTRIVNPNKRIDRDMTLNLGGVTAEIILTPGHTPTKVIAW